MRYTATVGDSDYEFDISYTMGWVQGRGDDSVWGVQDWSVTHVDGYANRLGHFWAEQLSDEDVCNSILEWESE